MGILGQISTTSQTELIGKMTENVNNKIPEYAREYKREYQFIRGINNDFGYMLNKLDNLNNGIFESKLANRIKFNMERFLKGQEKGKIKDISDLWLTKCDYCFMEEFYLYFNNEYDLIDGMIDKEFFEILEKIYSQIKIVILFSDYYGEDFYI